MKRCSGCDRTYADDKLSFCTACGGTLVVETATKEPAHDPFKTMMATPRPAGPLDASRVASPASAEPAVNPSWEDIGGKAAQSVAGQEPSRSLALGAMICGLVSLFCGFLVFLGPVAAIVGFIALNREKSSPQEYGGRGFALVGVITGILATLLFIGGLIVVGIMLATGTMNISP